MAPLYSDIEWHNDRVSAFNEISTTSQQEATSVAAVSRAPRTHKSGQRYEPDVQMMIQSLVEDHGMTKNVVYKYVDQGMKKGTIFDLDEFKQKCIAKWKRNHAIWGRSSSSRIDWTDGTLEGADKGHGNPGTDDDVYERLRSFMSKSSECKASTSTSADHMNHHVVQLGQTSISPHHDGKIVYRTRSKTGTCWRFTEAAFALMGDFMKNGMSRDTAKRYIVTGIESGKIYDLDKFKADSISHYLEQKLILGRAGRPAKSEYSEPFP